MVLSELSLLSLKIPRGEGGGGTGVSRQRVAHCKNNRYSSNNSNTSSSIGITSTSSEDGCTAAISTDASSSGRNFVTNYYSSSSSTSTNITDASATPRMTSCSGRTRTASTATMSSSPSSASSTSVAVVVQQGGRRFVDSTAILKVMEILASLRWILLLILLTDSVIGHASDGSSNNNSGGKGMSRDVNSSPYSQVVSSPSMSSSISASSSFSISPPVGGFSGGGKHFGGPLSSSSSPSLSRMIMLNSDSSSNSFNTKNTNSLTNNKNNNNPVHSSNSNTKNSNSNYNSNNYHNNKVVILGASAMALAMADAPAAVASHSLSSSSSASSSSSSSSSQLSSSSGDRDLGIITGPPATADQAPASLSSSSSSSENPLSPTHLQQQQQQQQPPRKNYPYIDKALSPNVTALLGKTAYLTCRVKNLGDKTVSWVRHRDIHLLTVGRYTYTTDQRFRAILQPSTDEYTLMIKYPQHRDSGIYECQVSTTPHLSHYLHLSVVEPKTEVVGGPELFIDRGSTINLTCTVKYSPEPPSYIIWNHNNAIISYNSPRGGVSVLTEKGETTTSYLLIQQARSTDSGKYSCNPSNAVPHSIVVHVLNGELPAAMQTGGQMPQQIPLSFCLLSSVILIFVTS